MSDRVSRSRSRHTPPRRHSPGRRNDSRNVSARYASGRNRSRETRDRSPYVDTRRRRRDSTVGRRDSLRSDSLNQILERLNALEGRLPITTSTPLPLSSAGVCTPTLVPEGSVRSVTGAEMRATGETTETPREENVGTADRIVGALSSLLQVRSKRYYISNFDPSVHDFDTWCAEVDRGRELNHWDDRECLGRIGGCLRGDAKSWLDEWVTSDRTWTNFKAEFRSMCPREIDMATILYEVMSRSSDKFITYAEYARKSLLRLNIVKGLSDELKTAIVIRGISDPQVKATATNAKLESKDLVEFLSVYVKTKSAPTASNPVRLPNTSSFNSRKRDATKYDRLSCHSCGKLGHKKINCPKKPRTENSDVGLTVPATSGPQPLKASSFKPVKICTFCKKTGHLLDSCFLRERLDSKSNSTKNSNNVNFCLETITNETM